MFRLQRSTMPASICPVGIIAAQPISSSSTFHFLQSFSARKSFLTHVIHAAIYFLRNLARFFVSASLFFPTSISHLTLKRALGYISFPQKKAAKKKRFTILLCCIDSDYQLKNLIAGDFGETWQTCSLVGPTRRMKS